METSQTVDYALRILLALEANDGRLISELAGELAIQRTALHRIVSTLHRRALIIRDRSDRYWLGPGLVQLARRVPHELVAIADATMRALAQRSGETVILAVREADEAVIVAAHSGHRGPLRVEYQVGFRQPLARGASSLAILASSDAESIRRLAPRDLTAVLAEVREKGYARTEGHIRPHMVGLAAPVFAHSSVVGSLAVIAPSVRAERLDDVLGELLESAADLGDRVTGENVSTRAGEASR